MRRKDRIVGRWVRGEGELLRDDAPNELVVIDLSVPARHTSQGSVPLFDPLFLEPFSRGKAQHRETLTHTVATPFNSSSTSASDIFSPNWVNTYRNSPAPIRPLPVLSNTWKPLMNSSARVEDGNGVSGRVSWIRVSIPDKGKGSHENEEILWASVPSVPAGLQPSGRLRICRNSL
jgi:hypothetical protein